MTFESTSSDDVLKYSMGVLKKIYKIARKKEDVNAMMGVADRLLVLFEGMSEIEKGRRQHPTGFARLVMEADDDRE
jgi:hypothetical protein